MVQKEDLKEKFEVVFEREIKPKLNNLEAKRLEGLKSYRASHITFYVVLALIIAVFLPARLWYRGQGGMAGLWMLLIPCLALIFSPTLVKIFSGEMSEIDFRQEAKNLFLKPLLSVFGQFRMSYDPAVTLGEVQRLGLFQTSTMQDYDDSIIGEYNNKPVRLCETVLFHTEERTNIRLRTREIRHTDFDGLIIKADIKKNFKGRCFVHSRSLLGALGNPRCAYEMEKINFEDVEFNNMYDVYSDDQIETRYLLTPRVIEKIKDIKGKLGVSYTSLVFDGASVYMFFTGIQPNTVKKTGTNVALGNGFFEVGSIEHSVLDKRIYRKAFWELAEIFDIIDCVDSTEEK